MASPQKENGYTKIANEILEALAKKSPGFSEAQVLISIIRKTYGWNKTQDSISIGQLQAMTGKSRRTVIYALQNLEAKNFIRIYRCKNGAINDTNKISFNKNHEHWVVQGKSTQYTKLLEKQRLRYNSEVVQGKEGSAKNGKGVVQRIDQNIEFLAPTKETIKKYTKERAFQKPHLEEVRAYIQEIGAAVDPERWFDYYESNGWRVGRNPMKSWKAAVRTWSRSSFIKPVETTKSIYKGSDEI